MCLEGSQAGSFRPPVGVGKCSEGSEEVRMSATLLEDAEKYSFGSDERQWMSVKNETFHNQGRKLAKVSNTNQ